MIKTRYIIFFVLLIFIAGRFAFDDKHLPCVEFTTSENLIPEKTSVASFHERTVSNVVWELTDE